MNLPSFFVVQLMFYTMLLYILYHIFLQVFEQNLKQCNVITGTIASGDIFCTDKWMKEKIHDKFDADCVEMEGAAIAQICQLNHTPFIVIRSISDKPNGKNHIDFNQFIEMASKRCADMIWECEKV